MKKRAESTKVTPLGSRYWRLLSAHAISNLGDGITSVAYPWLASAITRSPFLIALVAVLSRLPWLVFTLPAGVITDRFDRRKIIVAMDAIRGVLSVFVGVAIFLQRDSLPDIHHVSSLTALKTNWLLFAVLSIAALLFGFAEVLRDNAAQTLLPSVVEQNQLESANGKMWSVEFAMNSFVGPPLGSFILGIAIYLPFLIDASSFFISVALIASISTIVKSTSTTSEKVERTKINFRAEIKEGFTWLWRHELLRPMAIILGSLNGIGALTQATFILFAQEVLHTSVFVFAVLGMAGAIGGSLGGILGPKISARIGSGPSLSLTLLSGPAISLIIGFISNWQTVWVLTVITMIFAVLWNVITVSLRQSIIPGNLLGRVNSVYRFFAWGSIPIGTLIGGALVDLASNQTSREVALRTPYFVSAALGFAVFIFAAPRLTTAKIEAARAEGSPQEPK